MSRWDYGRWYRPSPKKPPPAHGIKMKRAGTTWWGERWIEALTAVLRGDAARLSRGRTYARAGRTHDLLVESGRVTAQVTGSRPKPYRVTIELAQLDEPTWTKAIAGMAEKAQFSSELLSGQMPQRIDDVFRAAGASLFPSRRADLVTDCSCPDWGDPCKHVAATHYVLGEALDRDPFLLFELRGKTRDQVLAALRAARGAGGGATARDHSAPALEAAPVAEPEIPKVRLDGLTAADYDKPRDALPSLHFSFDGPVAHGAVLKQLGKPAAWGGEDTPADAFAPLIRAAAETARRIAMAESRDALPKLASSNSDAPAPPRARSRPFRAGTRRPSTRNDGSAAAASAVERQFVALTLDLGIDRAQALLDAMKVGARAPIRADRR